MNSKFIKSILIPAILLILPVALVLIFDPAAWNGTANLLWDIFGHDFLHRLSDRDMPVALVQTGAF